VVIHGDLEPLEELWVEVTDAEEQSPLIAVFLFQLLKLLEGICFFM
jgi:hypothetical protein